MRQIRNLTQYAATAALAMVLTACGDGGGAGLDEGPPPQFGVTERELYDAGSNTAGIIARRGSGAVMIQLETAAGPALPLLGDTLSVGADSVWFDLVRDGTAGVTLTEQSLQIVAAVELYDATGTRIWRADTTQRAASLFVPRGLPAQPWPRYQLRITSAASATAASRVIVWFGDAINPQYNPGDVGRLAGTIPVNCPGCNLQGSNLGGYKLSGGNLVNANLRNAWLAPVDPAQLELRDGAIFRIFLDGSVVRGADLARANLTGADLTGAIISGAGRSGASLAGTNLTAATLNGVNLDGANMSGVNMVDSKARLASFIEVDLTNANLTQADLQGANLTKTDFSRANLVNADLRGSRLTGATLLGANLTGTLLAGATWTDGRICAAGSIGKCD